MYKNEKACHAPKTTQKADDDCKKDCCSNKKIEISADEDAQKIQVEHLSPKQIQFIATFVETFVLGHTDLSQHIIPHLNYKPPLLNRDIPVLIQSFLI